MEDKKILNEEEEEIFPKKPRKNEGNTEDKIEENLFDTLLLFDHNEQKFIHDTIPSEKITQQLEMELLSDEIGKFSYKFDNFTPESLFFIENKGTQDEFDLYANVGNKRKTVYDYDQANADKLESMLQSRNNEIKRITEENESFKANLDLFNSKKVTPLSASGQPKLIRNLAKKIQNENKHNGENGSKSKGKNHKENNSYPFYEGEVENGQLILNKTPQKLEEEILWLLPKNKIVVNKNRSQNNKFVCQKGIIRFTIELCKIKNNSDAVYLLVKCLEDNSNNEFMNIKRKVVNIINR